MITEALTYIGVFLLGAMFGSFFGVGTMCFFQLTKEDGKGGRKSDEQRNDTQRDI